MAGKRPDMRAYFRAQINYHVFGTLARTRPVLPTGVSRVEGSVTSAEISVVTADGSVWRWQGGAYASRKVHGTYAPLMPKPVTQ